MAHLAGKLVDFVVMVDDPEEVKPDAIRDIEVVRIDVGGRTMHEAGDAALRAANSMNSGERL